MVYVTPAPEPAPGRYAMALVAIEPSTTEQFIRDDTGSHPTPPTVGEFQPAIEPTVALAAWLELFARPVALAPPLLHTGERWQVAELRCDWPLAPYGSERAERPRGARAAPRPPPTEARELAARSASARVKPRGWISRAPEEPHRRGLVALRPTVEQHEANRERVVELDVG